jgi:hypothetical protein
MRPPGRFWPGAIVGVGIGLLLGSGLVEQEWLTPSHNAWATVLGALLISIGVQLSRRARKQESAGVEIQG